MQLLFLFSYLQISERSLAQEKKPVFLSSIGPFTAFGFMSRGSISCWNRFFANKNNPSFDFIFLVTFQNFSLSKSHFTIFIFSGLNKSNYYRFSLRLCLIWHRNSEHSFCGFNQSSTNTLFDVFDVFYYSSQQKGEIVFPNSIYFSDAGKLFSVNLKLLILACKR